MKQTVRAFIALEMDAVIHQRAAELIGLLTTANVQVSWVKPQNMHLTLKFLDEIPLTLIPELCAVVKTVAAGFDRFDLEIRGAGAFPSLSKPRTLWLGGGEGSEAVGKLHAALEKGLVPLGFRREPRRFAPHLTLGRIRNAGPGLNELGRILKQQADFDAGRTSLDELIIFSSDLTPQGPIYDVLGRSRLGRRT